MVMMIFIPDNNQLIHIQIKRNQIDLLFLVYILSLALYWLFVVILYFNVKIILMSLIKIVIYGNSEQWGRLFDSNKGKGKNH